jgi:hypothetical protein
MEFPEKSAGAEWCAGFFSGPNAPKASAHFAVDDDSIVQCVKETDGAWHTPGSLPAKGGREINRSSIGIEHAGYARQTEAEWLDAYGLAMLERSAELVAQLCVRHQIPPVRLDPAALVRGEKGICGHVDCTKATGVGSHWDPGPGFPWDWYMARVRSHHALLVTPVADMAEGEDVLDWPIVTLGKLTPERWYVSPTYLWPTSLGGAEELAKHLGCELPTPALVDAIWKAADLRIEPITRSVENGLLKDWGSSMASLETLNDQAERIEAAIAGRPFSLLAGTCKDVVQDEGGRLGLYGWHRLDGSIVQPFYAGHARGWIDYAQGLRLVRPVT